MARKFTVMGFTEAELGFALAAFFVAVSAGYLKDRSQLERHSDDLVRENATLRERLDSLKAEIRLVDSLKAKLEKISDLTPSCRERGESPEPIASFRILGIDRYELGGVELTFSAVQEILAASIQKSKRLGCKFTVDVIAIEGIDARQHTKATGRLRGLFYVHER